MQLLKKEGFKLSPEVTATFDGLKQTLSTTPIFQHLDVEKPFIVNCDASSFGFRAVLHQGDGALAFFHHLFVTCHLKCWGKIFSNP